MIKIEKFIENYVDDRFTQNDRKFLERVFSCEDVRYELFLKGQGIKEFNEIADMGAGFGQWSLALSKLNNKVAFCEPSSLRFDFFKKLVISLKIKNITCFQKKTETLNVQNAFDAIFSYGVLFCTSNWIKTIENMYVSLKSNGWLFLNFCTLDWFTYLWRTNHNENNNYNPARVVCDSFEKTYTYKMDPEKAELMPGQYIIERKEILKVLADIGFINISCKKESDIWREVLLNDKDNTLCEDRGIYFIKAQKK